MTAAPLVPPAVPPAPAKDPAAPGYTTTEFWLAGVAPLVVSLLTLFNIGHVDLTNNPTAQAVIKVGSLLAAGIGAAFYAHSRGHMKAGAVIAAALKAMDVGGFVGQGLTDIGNGLAQASYTNASTSTEPLQFNEDQLVQIVEAISPVLATHVEKAVDAFKGAIASAPSAPVGAIPALAPSDTFVAPSYST